MPKPHTFPTLLDRVNNITTRFLIDNGYLKPGKRSGLVTHSRGERITGRAGMATAIDDNGERGTLSLTYSVDGGPEKTYSYDLITKPSNLGRGRAWYFVCPATAKACRKLYSIGGRYLSRHAFPKAMYQNQTEGKDLRQVKQLVDPWPLNKRKTYAGKLTKAYVRHKVAEWKAQRSLMIIARRMGL